MGQNKDLVAAESEMSLGVIRPLGVHLKEHLALCVHDDAFLAIHPVRTSAIGHIAEFLPAL